VARITDPGIPINQQGRCSDLRRQERRFPKLDEAAVKEVQRNWRFVPGKEDGKPVAT
jgi:hypothetical protein